MRVWLIGGTQESRDIAQALAPELKAQGRWGWITVTTPSATALYPQGEPWRVRVVVWQGETLRLWLIQEQITQIIDASHPFASQISALAQGLAQEYNLSYLRYQRRECPLEVGVTEITALEELFSRNLLQGKRVFLTLGAKSLPFFRDYQDQAALFARILPTASSLELAQRGGFPPERLIALRPPVSEALELALWQQWQIETVVTKASGAPGGEAMKTQLAQRLQIPLIRLARPALRSATAVSSLEELLNWFKEAQETPP